MAIERQGGALDMRPTLFRYKEQKMERIRKAAKATSVIVIAILTALVVTALCSPEEDWTELAEMMESWMVKVTWKDRLIGIISRKR